MICYKDKTWCTYTKCVKSKICKEFFSKEDELNAGKWWDEFNSIDSPPVMKFTTKPKCYE